MLEIGQAIDKEYYEEDEEVNEGYEELEKYRKEQTDNCYGIFPFTLVLILVMLN